MPRKTKEIEEIKEVIADTKNDKKILVKRLPQRVILQPKALLVQVSLKKQLLKLIQNLKPQNQLVLLRKLQKQVKLQKVLLRRKLLLVLKKQFQKELLVLIQKRLML